MTDKDEEKVTDLGVEREFRRVANLDPASSESAFRVPAAAEEWLLRIRADPTLPPDEARLEAESSSVRIVGIDYGREPDRSVWTCQEKGHAPLYFDAEDEFRAHMSEVHGVASDRG